ncbi:MAG: UDP-3-O-(3-hydroxymyristoyl)glucosamine N-acyltransferase [Candidatus Nitrosocosmicus sp.]
MHIDTKKDLSEFGYNFETEGNSPPVTGFSSITEAGTSDVTFCYYEAYKAAKYIAQSNAGVILCTKAMIGKVHPKKNQQFYFLDNPRLCFIQLLKRTKDKSAEAKQISPNSLIHESTKIGKNCSIMPYTVVDKNSSIGDNCIIGCRVSIMNSSIGDNCIIQSGATIGEDGFAYERHQSGRLEHFPHLGRVIIEDNVDISANCSIARGSMTNTVIGEGTKLDALVHIAHNVKIGKHCELTAGTIIGGSTAVGNSTWTGLNSTLKDNIHVGNNVIVGAGAMVIKDVDDNDIVAGVPAKSIKSKVKTNLTFLMAGQKNSQNS